MSEVINPDAVVYPRTMAESISTTNNDKNESHLLVVFCNASLASVAMLATKRHPCHTLHAKVLIIEFPEI